MDWETVKLWVLEYGYLAVAVGTFLDQSGLQAFVVAGGVVAQVQREFSIFGVAAAGAVGSFTSDIIFWGIGRWRAAWLERIVRSDKGRARLKVLEDGMKRYAFPLIVFGRLLPWFGRFVPAAAGLRRVAFLRVVAFSVIGAVATAAAYAAFGYFAAGTVGHMEDYGVYLWVAALIISFPVAAWALRRFDRAVMTRLELEQVAEEDSTDSGS